MNVASLVINRSAAVDHGFGLNPDNFNEKDGEIMLKVRTKTHPVMFSFLSSLLLLSSSLFVFFRWHFTSNLTSRSRHFG